MNTITTHELVAKIDSGDRFHLIMTMSEAAFRRAHIPGSTHAAGQQDMARFEDRDAQIVVYCSGPECLASRTAYRLLESAGYRNLRHYQGGLSAWETAGLPLESGAARGQYAPRRQ